MFRLAAALVLGMFLAGTPGAVRATSYHIISGTVYDAGPLADTRDLVPLSGITVNAFSQGGPDPAPFVTGADGTFLLQIDAATDNGNGFYLYFSDGQHRYFSGWYDTSTPFNFGVGSHANLVIPGDEGATGIELAMYLGKRISGTVTGQGTPPKPLANVVVVAMFELAAWNDFAVTDADGNYSITVPGPPLGPPGYEYNYMVIFYPSSLYSLGCWSSGFAGIEHQADCVNAVVLVDSNLTGIDAQLPLVDGESLVLGPVGGTVPAGSAQSFTATLSAPGPQVRPADLHLPSPMPEMNPVVSGNAVFSMDGGGTCTHNSCTPPAEGDYTITATYGSATGQTTLHAGPALPTPSAPPAGSSPTSGTTPPPTSTGRSDGGGDGSVPVTILLGITAAAVVAMGLRRRVSEDRV